MPIRKNTRRFDPRYFMDEKTDIIKEDMKAAEYYEDPPDPIAHEDIYDPEGLDAPEDIEGEMEEKAKDFMQIYGEIPNLDISVYNDGYEPNFLVRIAKEETFGHFDDDAEAMRAYLDDALDRHWAQ